MHSLQSTLEYVRRLPPERVLPLSDRKITVETLRQTLEAFQQSAAHQPYGCRLAACHDTQFEVVPAAGLNERKEVLFTGYHEIVLEGSLTRTRTIPVSAVSSP